MMAKWYAHKQTHKTTQRSSAGENHHRTVIEGPGLVKKNGNVVTKYKWRRCSKKKCCKQCGQVKFMGTMTKWPVQKHTEDHKTRSKQGRNRHKEINIFCVKP